MKDIETQNKEASTENKEASTEKPSETRKIVIKTAIPAGQGKSRYA